MDTNLRLSKSCCEPASDGDDDASCSPLLVQSIDGETKRRKKPKIIQNEWLLCFKVVELCASKTLQGKSFQPAELLLLRVSIPVQENNKAAGFPRAPTVKESATNNNLTNRDYQLPIQLISAERPSINFFASTVSA